MLKITISSITPSTFPADGVKAEYRKKGTGVAYTLAVGSPFTALPIVFNISDGSPAGTLYEVRLWRDCGPTQSIRFATVTPCNCDTASGFNLNAGGDACEKLSSTGATIEVGGCLAVSNNPVYTTFGSRIYNSSFTADTMFLPIGTIDPGIYGEMTSSSTTFWRNAAGVNNVGPFNRSSVWVDTDCDGNRDFIGRGLSVITKLASGSGYTNGTYNNVPLLASTGVGAGATAQFVITGGIVSVINETLQGSGYKVGDVLSVALSDIGGTGSGLSMQVGAVNLVRSTLSASFNNTGLRRTVYMGVSSGNEFEVRANGVTVVNTINRTGFPISDIPYRIWHIVPVTLEVGINYYNVVVTGAGTTIDAEAMVIYDNTPAQIMGATSNSQLNILFDSKNLRGVAYDVATCASGYALDVSGGVGAYMCRKKEVEICNII